MASFAAFATRNFTTFLAGILIDSPVAGLRPIRAFRSTLTSRPIPGNTNTPFFCGGPAPPAYSAPQHRGTAVRRFHHQWCFYVSSPSWATRRRASRCGIPTIFARLWPLAPSQNSCEFSCPVAYIRPILRFLGDNHDLHRYSRSYDRQFRSSGTLQPVHQEMPNRFSATEVRPLRKRGRPITTWLSAD
jgi:hypothetical protein